MNEKTLNAIKNIVMMQSQSSTNCDEYNRGVYNGMELLLAIIEDREPNYKELYNCGCKCKCKYEDKPCSKDHYITGTTMDYPFYNYGPKLEYQYPFYIKPLHRT